MQGLEDLDYVLVWFVVLLVEVGCTGEDVDGDLVVAVEEDLLEVDQDMEVHVVEVVERLSVDSRVLGRSVLLEEGVDYDGADVREGYDYVLVDGQLERVSLLDDLVALLVHLLHD